MRETNQTRENLETLTRYEYGALAGRLIRTDPSLASQSLMLLNERLNDDEGTKDLMNEFVYSNERGIRKASDVYAGSYEKALDSLSVEELSSDYYGDALKALAEREDLVKVKKELGKFAGENFGDIKKKLKKADYVIRGVREKTYDFSKKEIKEAEDTLKKYANMSNVLSVLEEAKLESLRPSVVERHYKTMFKSIVGEIKDSD
ncbi:MAG: hypothetical protein IIA85_02165 [Nanoarchaeota archaeon]|nr:hypothetical protein [Nanoarchaeota archaeon]